MSQDLEELTENVRKLDRLAQIKIEFSKLIGRSVFSITDLQTRHLELQTELQIKILEELMEINVNSKSTNSTIPPMGDDKKQKSPSS